MKYEDFVLNNFNLGKTHSSYHEAFKDEIYASPLWIMTSPSLLERIIKLIKSGVNYARNR